MGDAHKKLRWLIHKWLRNWKKKISSQYSLCTFTLMLFLRFFDGWNELHINLLYSCLWLIYKEKFFLRRCSLSCVTWMLFSRIPWWLERKVSFTKLVDNKEWEMPTEFHDDWTINSWVIRLIWLISSQYSLCTFTLMLFLRFFWMVRMNFLAYKSPILLS